MMKYLILAFLLQCNFLSSQDSIKTIQEETSIKGFKRFKVFHENGILKISGFKKNNMPDSLWRYFDKNGKLTYKVLYRNNKLIYTNNVNHKNGKDFYIKMDLLQNNN